jgi:hypothetical protein
LAGPIRSWTPSPALRMAAWGHALAVAVGLGRTGDIEFLAERFEPFRGRHVANGAGPGVYMGPVELQLGLAPAALGRLDAAAGDLETAPSICDAQTAPAGTPSKPGSSSPRRWPAGGRRATWTGRERRLTPPRGRQNGSRWCRSPSG